MDLFKAFDQVNHSTLIKTLQHRNVPTKFCDWYKNYLTCRTYCVRLNNNTSKDFNVISGVPQGCVLSPIIFNIFITAIDPVDHFVVMYADDTTIVIQHLCYDNINDEILQTIKYIEQKFSTMDLQVNREKTKWMLITKNNKWNRPKHEELDCYYVPKLKILGVHLSNDLKWNEHINYITKKAFGRIFALRLLKKSLTKDELIIIYNCFIRSILEYGSSVFIGLSTANKKSLKKVQRRAHNVICQPSCHCNILANLDDRRSVLAMNIFKEAASHSVHLLHNLIPMRMAASGKYDQFYSRTECRKKTFLPTMTKLANTRKEK